MDLRLAFANPALPFKSIPHVKLIIDNGTANTSTFMSLQLTESESEELTLLSQISATKIGLSIG